MGQRGKSNKRLRLLRKDWLAEQTATSEIVNGWDSADVPLGILIERSKLYKIVQRDVSGPWWEKQKWNLSFSIRDRTGDLAVNSRTL